jgi:hypothetical protein
MSMYVVITGVKPEEGGSKVNLSNDVNVRGNAAEAKKVTA